MDNNKTQLIIAVMSFTGVVSVALLNNWEKVFSAKKLEPLSSPQVEVTPLNTTPPQRYADTTSITTQNTSQPIDAKRWRWSVFIHADANALSKIRCVEYRLHPTFPDPIKMVCDAKSHFALSATGWGTFTIKVKVIFKDGSIKHLNHPLSFGTGT